MNRLCLLLAALFVWAGASAQNIQIHYDFGSKMHGDLPARPKITTTVEQFHSDKWGSTFYFVDMNYRDSGIESAYWEISRELILSKSLPMTLHLEYNGGLSNQFSYEQAYLVGATYAYHNKSRTFGLGITPMYKYLAKQDRPHSAQLTATWYWHFIEDAFTFTGLADVWGDRDGAGKSMPIFVSEPQLWVNLNRFKGFSDRFNLSLGAEVELSYNFLGRQGRLYAIPTLAAKWTF